MIEGNVKLGDGINPMGTGREVYILVKDCLCGPLERHCYLHFQKYSTLMSLLGHREIILKNKKDNSVLNNSKQKGWMKIIGLL